MFSDFVAPNLVEAYLDGNYVALNILDYWSSSPTSKHQATSLQHRLFQISQAWKRTSSTTQHGANTTELISQSAMKHHHISRTTSSHTWAMCCPLLIKNLGVGRDHASFNHAVLVVHLSAPLRIPAASSRTHGIQEPAGSDARSWTCLPTRRMLYTAPWVMIWRQAVKLLSPLRCTS